MPGLCEARKALFAMNSSRVRKFKNFQSRRAKKQETKSKDLQQSLLSKLNNSSNSKNCFSIFFAKRINLAFSDHLKSVGMVPPNKNVLNEDPGAPVASVTRILLADYGH